MATSDWLRPFDFDRVFWSNSTEESSASLDLPATQQTLYEGLGAKIVEDVMNVSAIDSASELLV